MSTPVASQPAGLEDQRLLHVEGAIAGEGLPRRVGGSPAGRVGRPWLFMRSLHDSAMAARYHRHSRQRRRIGRAIVGAVDFGAGDDDAGRRARRPAAGATPAGRRSRRAAPAPRSALRPARGVRMVNSLKNASLSTLDAWNRAKPLGEVDGVGVIDAWRGAAGRPRRARSDGSRTRARKGPNWCRCCSSPSRGGCAARGSTASARSCAGRRRRRSRRPGARASAART